MIKYDNFSIESELVDGEHKMRLNISPLDKGFGLTLGNALRRILLVSVRGVGMFGVQIDGVVHEFSSVKNIQETVVKIILNLRKIIFALDLDLYPIGEKAIIMLQEHKEGLITANDLILPTGVKVINPKFVIANAKKANVLKMKIFVQNGVGYKPFSENKNIVEFGTIATDSDFSPVVNVKYNVEDYQLTKEETVERLTMEIETDKSVSAKQAFSDALSALQQPLSRLDLWVNDKLDDNEEAENNRQVSEENFLAEKTPIEHLNLTVRCYNSLKNANINFVNEIKVMSETELLKIKNMGARSLEEIKMKLQDLNLNLVQEGENNN